MKFQAGVLTSLLTTSSAFHQVSHNRRQPFLHSYLHATSSTLAEADFYESVTRENGSLATNSNKRVTAVLPVSSVTETIEDQINKVNTKDDDFLKAMDMDTPTGYETDATYKTKEEIQAKKIVQANDMVVSDFLLYKGIPATVLGWGGFYGYKYLKEQYNTKLETVLANYANEMIFHDGDFGEMEMCYKEYKKKLGPGPKRNRMLSYYLEQFAKKKTVSPQAISSLAKVFDMFKLNEPRAAKVMVQAAENLSTQPASRSKLLFFGEHILKSPAALSELQPIRDMLAAAYRSNGAVIVANGQKTIAEAAYKNVVIEGGDRQESLTKGWQTLGLSQEDAQRIFDEVAADGFMSETAKLYRQELQQYDDKGRKIDKQGQLVEGEEEEDEEDDGPKGNVFECSQCGFTMFPAAGREGKFFGDGFKCPECGASKDKFVSK